MGDSFYEQSKPAQTASTLTGAGKILAIRFTFEIVCAILWDMGQEV